MCVCVCVCVPPGAVNQLELNIYSSREQLVEYCKNEGIMVEAFYPYGRGFRLEYPKTVQIAQRYEIQLSFTECTTILYQICEVGEAADDPLGVAAWVYVCH